MQRKLLLFFALLTLGSAPAFALKEYQVTGPVLELTPTAIVVQKGKDRWEIARDANTKIEGTPAAGQKVTVYYSMSATAIDVKADKKSAKGK